MVFEDEGVARELYRLGAELRRHTKLEIASDAWLARAGIRPLATAVLMVVAGIGPCPQRAISDTLDVDPSDIVSMLDQLEQAGFVERQRDPEDRRRNAVVITADGRKAAERIADLARRAEAAALARLSPREREQLARLLHRAVGTD
jgi:DNA-binding MarR family transcriptional regulator